MEREDAAGHRGQEEGEAETEGMSEQSSPRRTACCLFIAAIGRGAREEQWGCVGRREVRVN